MVDCTPEVGVLVVEEVTPQLLGLTGTSQDLSPVWDVTAVQCGGEEGVYDV